MEEKMLQQIISVLGNLQNSVQDMQKDISNIKGDISNLNTRMESMENRMESMETRIDNLENGVYDGFAKITDYIDKSETRIKLFVENQTQKKIGALQDGYLANHEKLNDHREKLNNHEERISRLEDTALF